MTSPQLPPDGPTGADAFTTSAQRVVDYLNAHTPIGDWAVSRIAGGEQVHLHVHHDDIVEVGARFDYDDTFCKRMVHGAARVVSDTQLHDDYRDLALAAQLRAYAGVPIANDDGSLFGVLCGLREAPLRPEEKDRIDEALLGLLSGVLGDQLGLARQLDRGRRQIEVSEALSQVDALTGLLNRHGWNLLVADAQERIDAYGDLVSVAVIDLDGLKTVNDRDGHQAGDALLQRAADALRAMESLGDRIARYGGDEFAILAHNVAAQDLEMYFRRFVDALESAGTPGSLGYALVGPGYRVEDAFAQADERMYEHKRGRRAGRSVRV